MKTIRHRLGQPERTRRNCFFFWSDRLFLAGPFLFLLLLTATLDIGTASFIMVDLSQYVNSKVGSDQHHREDHTSGRRSARRNTNGTNKKKGAVSLSLLVPSKVTQLLPQEHDSRSSFIHPMVPSSSSTSSSVMGQTKNRKSQTRKTGHPALEGRGFLVPSQVLRAHADSIQPNNDKASTTTPSPPTKVASMLESSSLTSDNNTNNETMNQHPPMTGRAKRRKRRNGQRPNATMSSADVARMGPQTNLMDSTTTRRRDWTGNLPHIEWRALPMDHLRQHPNFRPLPHPEDIQELHTVEEARLFRQDSWQWDALHSGRCTTSQAAAALGLLEPIAGEALGVPRSLRHGGLGAFHRLSAPQLVQPTVQDMNDKLVTKKEMKANGKQQRQRTDEGSSNNSNNTSNNPWTAPTRVFERNGVVEKPFPFAAKYKPRISERDRQERRHVVEQLAQINRLDGSVRMMWGTVQEATALLTALNYFWEKDESKSVMLQEVGMCGAGLDVSTGSSKLGRGQMLLGATPDALLCHSDGRIEALEVKNHCPFRFNKFFKTKEGLLSNGVGSKNASNQNDGNNNNNKRFSIQRFGFDDTSGVLPQYVPQLMMEMLCVGPECLSAIMVRQTATNGALIVRILRDDGWIAEMLYWLDRFHQDFVQPGIPPPPNFFWTTGTTADMARYKKFVAWTKEVESNVQVLDHVPNIKIQRVLGTTPQTLDLFLD